MRKVLIFGAGIAGATAAYWLAKGGFEVTVVEQDRGMRSPPPRPASQFATSPSIFFR
jgi:2-polyprenyl-6-methoxyphenol hydroxylase-like FAD-dependent oxidoreductase